MSGRQDAGPVGRKRFHLDERIVKFDEKAVKFEEIRNSGVGGMSLGMIFVNSFAVILMIVPFGQMLFEETGRVTGGVWTLIQGCLLMIGVYLRMQWLLGLERGGKMISWKEYLKYVPVDWKEYRRHRIWVLLRYTGKMLFCYVILQGISQLCAIAVMGAEAHWGELVYAPLMCMGWILLPGLFFIWRWC